MKLKQSPDDFRVEELTDLTAGDRGDFALYRLDKRGWTTPDALAAIRRRWQIDFRRLSYGGLKDRHADTSQFFTILRGPKRDMEHHTVRVTYLGQVERPFGSPDIRANRFRLVLRDLTPARAESAASALDEVARDGVPNYFDDQRFGSVSSAGTDFIAGRMVRGDFEGALKLALAVPYEFDRAEQKREKAILLECWGDWPTCKAKLPRGHARSLVDYLVSHPTDFRGAVARLRPELRGLYLSAYQSHLWNRLLARWLTDRVPAERLVSVRLRLGVVPMHRSLFDSERHTLAAVTLPLPSARLKWDESADWAKPLTAVLAEEGLELAQIRVRGFDKPFFSKGERPVLCLPREVTHASAPDDKHAGRAKLVLSFDLPRGAYATLIVKRISDGGPPPVPIMTPSQPT